MTMNNVSIPVSSIVTAATSPSDGSVSPPVQSGGVFFRSLAGAPANPDNHASQPKPQTQSSAPASNSGNSGNSGDSKSATSSTAVPTSTQSATRSTTVSASTGKTSSSGNLKKAGNSATTDSNGSGTQSADTATSDPSAPAASSSTATPVTAASTLPAGNLQPADPAPSSNSSGPPAGVVELLANAANATKRAPASSPQTVTVQTSSGDDKTGTPTSLAEVLSQAGSTSATEVSASGPAPQSSATGSSAKNGTLGSTTSPTADATANLAAGSAVQTSSSLAQTTPSAAQTAPNPAATPTSNVSGRFAIGTVSSANVDPSQQSPAAATAASEASDETLAADPTGAAQTSATPTILIGPPMTAAGQNKGTGTSDQSSTTKTSSTEDQTAVGVTSSVSPPQSSATSSTGTTSHVSGAATSDALQRTQELVDRVTSSLRSGFDNGGQLRMRLEPPAIGKVQVEVAAGNNGVTARLEVQSAAARQTLLDNISLLHTAITQTGAAVNRIDVVFAPQTKDDAPSDQQSNSGSQQQSANQDNSHGGSQNQQNGQRQKGTAGKSSSLDELDIEV